MKSGVHRLTLAPLLALALTTALASAQNPTWQISEVNTYGDVGDHAQLAIDAQGRPHIAHVNFTHGSLFLESWNGVSWVRRFIDDNVVFSGNFSPTTVVDLKIDSAGAFHFAYISDMERANRFNDVEVRYARLDDLTAAPVRSRLHTHTELIPAGAGVGIVLDTAEVPHVLAMIGGSPNDLLHFWQPAPNGQWLSEDVAGAANLNPVRRGAAALSFTIDSAGQFHAAMIEDEGLYYLTGDANGSWTASLMTPPGTRHHDVLSDLIVDSAGRVHLLAVRETGNVLDYHTFDGATWQIETVADDVSEVDFVLPAFDLALDSANQPHVVYRVGDVWTYATRDAGGTWSRSPFLRDLGELTGDPGGLLGPTFPNLDLEMGPDNRPWVALDTGRPFANLLLANLTEEPWTVMTVDEGDSDTRFKDVSMSIDDLGNPSVSYHLTPDVLSNDNELRYAARNEVTGEWQIDPVLSNSGADRGIGSSLAGTAISSFSAGLLQTEFSTFSNGAWTTEPVLAPQDVNQFQGHSLILHRFLRQPEIFGTVQPRGIGVAIKENAQWRIFPDSPQGANETYVVLDAINPVHSNNPNLYYVIYAVRFTIFMAIWDGTSWIQNEPVSTTLRPGAFPANAAIDWDESRDVPVVVYSRRDGATSQPIELARRATGDPVQSSWEIGPVHNPGYPFSDLDFVNAAGREVVAFTGILRPVTVLTREADAQDWEVETISNDLGAGAGLDLEVANDLDWLAYTYRTFGGRSGVRVAIRNSLGAFDTLAGTVDYGERPYVNYNPVAPCPSNEDNDNAAPSPKRLPRKSHRPPVPENDLSLLRTFRDMARQTPEGQRLIDLYYAHRAELAGIGATNPILAFRTLHTMRNFLPGVIALAEGHGKGISINEEMVDQALRLAESIGAEASPDLGAAITTELQRYNQLDDFVGMSFEQAAERVGIPASDQALRVLAVRYVDQRFTIEVENLPDHAYTLWKRPSLAEGSWEQVPGAQVTVGNDRVILEESNVSDTSLFYRVQAVPAGG